VDDISGKLKPQLEFARFLEENGADVRAPSAGELLEAVPRPSGASQGQLHQGGPYRQRQRKLRVHRRDDGKTRGGIELPTKFVLGLPVYFGEPDTEMHAFLRWKLNPTRAA
jgi:hypothetical protein